MPAKLPEGIARKLTTTIRLSQAERERLASVAATRGDTVSGLLREGLFAIGALEVEAT
jgi:predicted DNA-binding protein